MHGDIELNIDVEKLQILDTNGNAGKDMPELTEDDVKKMYGLMVLARTFDDKAFKLQRQGRLGTYAPILGQEAAQIGSAMAMKPTDWFFPMYRSAGVSITLGYPMDIIFQYWSGDERGSKTPDNLNIFPVAIPVGTQMPHATGAAMAARILHKDAVSIVYFGDGASSKADFHEGLNFAGVFKAPVIYLCENNQYAISLPRERQTAAKTIAQKAIAYGVHGIFVDGNDVFAVYKAVKEARERAASGQGATLIECYTYRMGDHTTSDDASRYRKQEEVNEWKKKDPIDRLRKFLEKRFRWTEKDDQLLKQICDEKVEEAVKKMETIPKPSYKDIFNYTYAQQTPQLREQMEYLEKIVNEKEK